ncbi:hypothetical protein Tco_0702696 [Tanacetum coccineum]|uniref:Uncharacterized protein n=1 Tax=Tanacetum coccineum TaxID=301880 RepID=A0ABQ4XWR6_9ASTR
MIDQNKIMVAAGGSIMRKTPQEAYDLIENMIQHHYQWDSKVHYDTTTDMSAHYSKTTFASSEQVEVLGNDTEYTIQKRDILLLRKLLNIDLTKDPPPLELNNDLERDILFLDNLLKDEPVEAKKVSKKPLDSLNPISETFDMTIINPLFDFDSEFTLNSDDPIFDI